jgi:hypothetical protein
MSASAALEKARERTVRAAKTRRVRIFLIGLTAGLPLSAAGLMVARALEPSPAWHPITTPPPKHMIVVVMRQDGEWRTGYLDDRGQMLSPENGAIIHGAWWWMAIPPKP